MLCFPINSFFFSVSDKIFFFDSVAAKDVKKLYKRFKKLDKDGNGLVSREEFLMVPELALNPLVKRFFSF